MDPEKSTELFVPTQLNYVHFDETPDLYKHTEKSRIYFYNSDENKCDNLIDCVETSLTDSIKESSILITSSTVNLPINALCKSSSSESDACSSTRLLDNNNIDDSIVGYEMTYKSDKLSSLHHHQQQNHPHHPNPLTTMIEMSNKYQVSDISYTDLKPTSPVTLTSSESETFWSKVHSSMSSNIRRRYLDSHRANESPSSSTGQRSFFGCPISKTRFSLILICTLLTSAFTIFFFGLLTLSEFPLWNSLINFQPFKFASHGYSSPSLSPSSGSSSSSSSLYGPLGSEGAKWWHDALVYEIFVASFKDSDSDGFGDIKGIHEKLSYLRDLGVTIIRLNSIFHALDYPYSYENVINFTRLDPHLGEIGDLNNLVTELHSKGMKLILDINLSITSDQHPWVANWLANTSSKYRNHYVNTSVITPIVHNVVDTNHLHQLNHNHNHLSHYPFGGYFYLNWSNPIVQTNMISCLQFWLQHGIDGFYLLNINEIHLDPEYPEAILEILDSVRSYVTSFRSHSWPGEKILLANRQSLDIINERLRSARADQLLDHFHHPHHHDNLFPEAIQMDDQVIKGSRKHIKSSPFRSTNNNEKNVYYYFDLVNIFLTIELNSSDIIRDQVNGYFLNTPKSRPWVLWSIGSVTKSRLATRVGKDYTLVSTFLLVMLPGSINFFYGDEIGLTDAIDSVSGKEYRAGQLCPIPWTSELNGNFSSGNLSHPWLPVNSNYLLNNIQRESETINRLQQLIGFRQYNLRSGWTEKQGNYLFHYVNEGFLALERYFTRTMVTGTILRHRFVLFANIGTIGRIKDFTDKFHFGTIKITSNPKRIQDFLYLRSLNLEPGEALIAEME